MPEFVSLFDFVPDSMPESAIAHTPSDALDLRRFDAHYAAEAGPSTIFSEVPDGRFRVQITDLELTLASTGNPVLKFGLRIMDGEHRKRMLWKRRVITENTIRYVKSELMTCGLRLERFSQLPLRLEELQGIELDITKVTKKDNCDIYFNRRAVEA